MWNLRGLGISNKVEVGETLKRTTFWFFNKCTVCKKLFNRRNLQHGCKDITNVDMLLFSRDGKKGEEAVREYRRYETEVMPTHITRVKKGDKNEPEKEKVGEQERGKIEYKEMEPPIIEKRGDKRPMSEPRHENRNQKRLRTVISETIHCVDIGKLVFLMRKEQPEVYQY
jgi:hypothetical protein